MDFIPSKTKIDELPNMHFTYKIGRKNFPNIIKKILMN